MTVVIDKFAELQGMIDQIIKAQETAAKVDYFLGRQVEESQRQIEESQQQIEELQLKTERLRYAVMTLGVIMAVHILYHVFWALSLGA